MKCLAMQQKGDFAKLGYPLNGQCRQSNRLSQKNRTNNEKLENWK